MASSASTPAPGKENTPIFPPSDKGAASVGKRKAGAAEALGWAPPRKQSRTDPLVGYGKHFGRTVRTFCHMQTVISNGLSRTMQIELGRLEEEDLPFTDLQEQRIYRRLLGLSPGLEERLNVGSAEELHYVASMINKGIGQARSDDTKTLKSAVIDWITLPNEMLRPSIPCNLKNGRGFHHERTGWLLCPVHFDWNDPKIRRDLSSGLLPTTGDLWPRFIFRNYEYNSRDPWDGLLRSSILIKAFKHVFTSPSSVDGKGTTTRSSNARIHGMTEVTVASIAYITTQVRFSLTSCNTFCQTEKATDSEGFYIHVLDLLEDPEEQTEVADLLKWYNQQVFPAVRNRSRQVHEDSVPAKVKERRRLINEGLWPLLTKGAASSRGASQEIESRTQ